MSSDQLSQYELGKTLGNIDGRLESIDQRLEKGDETMQALSTKIDDGFKEQSKIIHAVDKELGEHKQKGHHCQIAVKETNRLRLKVGGLATLIVGIITLILKSMELI